MKPIGTTASTTAFCAEKLTCPGCEGYLWIDGNGKITAGNGTLDNPRPNAFSLVEIEDCPGSTAVCRASCYVHGLKQHAPDTHALYVHNSTEIRRILKSDEWLLWGFMLARWIRWHARGGFRWHVSGDVFSEEYARWIAFVAAESDVMNWIYTRSFGYVPLLKQAHNLVVNLSADAENYERAKIIHAAWDARICYLTTDGTVPDDLPDGSVIFPDYSLRGGTEAGQAWFAGLSPQYKSFVCPVDWHGKAENRRCGPCDRCLK